MSRTETGQARPKSAGGSARLRIVVDGLPKHGEPVGRLEHRIPLVGWRPLPGALTRLADRRDWKCSIEASDDERDYRYEVNVSDVDSVETLNETLKRYALDLMIGVDQSKINKLLLTATPVSQ